LLLDIANIVKTECVSADGHAKGLGREKDQAEEQSVVDVLASAVVPNVGASPAKDVSSHNIGAGDIGFKPHHSKRVSHDAVCGLLMELVTEPPQK
jgi:hypothetical protein